MLTCRRCTGNASANCPAGGHKLVLEVPRAPVYVCHGEEGAEASIVVTEEPPGANCAHGGQRIDSSVGTRPVVTSYVCNGVEK